MASCPGDEVLKSDGREEWHLAVGEQVRGYSELEGEEKENGEGDVSRCTF